MTVPHRDEEPFSELPDDARKALEEGIYFVRETIVTRAYDIAEGDHPKAADIEAAIESFLESGEAGESSARESDVSQHVQRIIDLAFSENRVHLVIAYTMAAVLFVVGVTLLVLGSVGGQGVGERSVLLLTGTFTQVLLLMPVRMALSTHRHNVGIRMLGELIARSDRADHSTVIRETLRSWLGKGPPSDD